MNASSRGVNPVNPAFAALILTSDRFTGPLLRYGVWVKNRRTANFLVQNLQNSYSSTRPLRFRIISSESISPHLWKGILLLLVASGVIIF